MDKDALEALIEQTVQRTAPLAVSETLIRFGIDSGNPIEVQKDLAFLREHRATVQGEEYEKDMQHLRSWRHFSETVKSNGVIAAVTLVVTGALGFLGIKLGLS